MIEGNNIIHQLTLHVMLYHRWIFVLCILPASVIMECLLFFYKLICHAVYGSGAKRHAVKVANVQKQVKDWKNSDFNTPMTPSEFGWSKIFRSDGTKPIIMNMSDIISVDEEKNTIFVEPYATIGEISTALLPLGWSLPIHPQREDLTVGGLLNGIGIESSSHYFGSFKDTCVSFDIVTADGEFRHCSKNENQDIFNAVPSSYGTLGFVVAAELSIIQVKKYVKLEYIPEYSISEAVKRIEDSCHSGTYNFVEGLVFSEKTAVVVRGSFKDLEPGATVNRLSCWWKPWFYLHVSKFLRKGRSVEFVPIEHYYRRHSRSYFWMLKEIIPFGNHWLFRFLFGWASPPKVELLRFTMTSGMSKVYENTRMVQDVLVPIHSLEKALTYVFKNVKVFPVWLCPCRCFNKSGLIHPSSGKDELYVDIGLYGKVGISDYHPIECTRALETFVRRANGHQMLYANSYQTRDEFSKMFDRSLYDMVRGKLPYCTKAFPDVFDKTTRGILF